MLFDAKRGLVLTDAEIQHGVAISVHYSGEGRPPALEEWMSQLVEDRVRLVEEGVRPDAPHRAQRIRVLLGSGEFAGEQKHFPSKKSHFHG